MEAGIAMLEAARLAFSQVRTFNDPTETSAAAYIGEESSFARGLLPRHFILNETYAIACLTRTALNPIMWAHYGKSHTGLVIGIDSIEAGLESNENNVLPARYGAVTYTASKPVHPYELSEENNVRRGRLFQYHAEYLEALQRMFLQKSTEWGYEEEIRVVRTVENLRQNSMFRQAFAHLPTWGTYLTNIPRTSIRSVHLGSNSLTSGYDTAHDALVAIAQAVPHAELYECGFARDSWRMEHYLVSDWWDRLQQIYSPN
jgi:hypothetical protein